MHPPPLTTLRTAPFCPSLPARAAAGTVVFCPRVLNAHPKHKNNIKEDLDPVTSRHNLHHMRTVYLRLRYLADAGCVFLGHGLDNDFRMCNLTLPPAQVKFKSLFDSRADV